MSNAVHFAIFAFFAAKTTREFFGLPVEYAVEPFDDNVFGVADADAEAHAALDLVQVPDDKPVQDLAILGSVPLSFTLKARNGRINKRRFE